MFKHIQIVLNLVTGIEIDFKLRYFNNIADKRILTKEIMEEEDKLKILMLLSKVDQSGVTKNTMDLICGLSSKIQLKTIRYS